MQELIANSVLRASNTTEGYGMIINCRIDTFNHYKTICGAVIGTSAFTVVGPFLAMS